MKIHKEISNIEDVHAHLADHGGSLAGVVVQDVDLSRCAELLTAELAGAVFLGGKLDPAALERALRQGALVFPALPDVPFDAYRGHLYTPEELCSGYTPGGDYSASLDGRIYDHYKATGGIGAQDIVETLARRLHDHAITDALQEFIAGKQVAAIMGGHALLRDDPSYAAVARIGRALCRRGFLMASGGGPGAMEATHLGAQLAGYDDAALTDALEVLAVAPNFTPQGPWLDAALTVRRRFPQKALPNGNLSESLGIPTWLYGHEPPTPLASDIAKYFANSVREDGLLTIAKAGIVFTPGSAGTIQEIFQDATQNHYKSVDNMASPMIFFNSEYWTETKPVYPLLSALAKGRDYEELLWITDDVEEVVERIVAFRDGDAR